MDKWPRFSVKRTGGKLAVNPDHVTAVYETSEGETEIFTLDCARDTDAWDVKESFDEVVSKLEGKQGEKWKEWVP